MFPGLRSAWKDDGTQKQYFVYVLSNTQMTLYTGVTNDLERRTAQHAAGMSEFTSRYHFDRVVYYEMFDDPLLAITREKQIKGMTRAKKIAMIKRENPGWRDLLSP